MVRKLSTELKQKRRQEKNWVCMCVVVGYMSLIYMEKQIGFMVTWFANISLPFESAHIWYTYEIWKEKKKRTMATAAQILAALRIKPQEKSNFLLNPLRIISVLQWKAWNKWWISYRGKLLIYVWAQNKALRFKLTSQKSHNIRWMVTVIFEIKSLVFRKLQAFYII